MNIAAWILSILGAVLIGGISDLILPGGKMNKFMKSVMATVVIFLILLPLPSLIKNGLNLQTDDFFNPKITLDQNFLEYSDKLKIGYLERGTQNALSADGIKNAEVHISGKAQSNELKIDNVKINLKNVVIDKDLQHINKYELVMEKVTMFLNIPKEIIVIYE